VTNTENFIDISPNTKNFNIDVCGWCHDNGVCNTITRKCECFAGFTNSVDCSLNDAEKAQEIENRKRIFQG
jgi:hypothetical protein